MDTTNENESKEKFLFKISNNSSIIIIIFGILIRVFMLIYYYYIHLIEPQRAWGDVGRNFYNNHRYPPLGTFLIDLFILLSFGKIEIFTFWAFFWELLTSLMFYYVLKNFSIENINRAFGLFLINPFLFLNNVFSPTNCGYHITDSFFFFFLFLALIYYPKKEIRPNYLFYVFLTLSMCAKYYTLPALGFFFLKYLYEKDWKELRIFIISSIPLLILLLIIPFIFIEKYFTELYGWYEIGNYLPLYLRIIPITFITIIFIIFRLKKSNHLEISIISTIIMGSFMIFSFFYLRWFQSIIFYGILSRKEFFTFNLKRGFIKKEIRVDNHLITFYLSFIGVLLSYLVLIF